MSKKNKKKKSKKSGIFSFIPDDIMDEMKANLDTVWDEVRANQYFRNHGREDLRNKGFDLQAAKEIINKKDSNKKDDEA